MKKPKELLYRISPYNGGVVFATPERARLVDRIHRAIATSRTWAEFRRAMPRDEYSSIVRSFDRDGEPRPRGSEPFDGGQLPGFSDGDYPPWLQREMGRLLPRSFLDQFASQEDTVLSGDYVMIRKASLEAVLAALRSLGYEAREADDLNFH